MEKLGAVLELRKEQDRLAFFEPNGPQTKFIEMVGHGRGIVGIFSAANGVGKTALAVNLLGNLIFGPQNKYFDAPLFANWPYPRRARFITDPKLVEEIGPFHSEIEKWWPRGRYEALKAGKNYYSQYKANGWVVDVMTNDQEIRQFEGGTLGLILNDEPPVEAIWNASIARLRLGGLMLCFMTPLTHAAWFYDKVVPRHGGSIIYAAMEENCKQHGIRGQLEHTRIQEMIAEMPPEEVEARAYGKAMYLKGLIYKTFDPKVHVLRETIKVPGGAPVWQVVDPHSDKPFACIWAFPDMNGDLYIVDEWPNEDFYKMHNCQLTIEDYKRIFSDKEQNWNVHRRIIDRHFADVRTSINRRTLREELQDIGLYYQPSYQSDNEIDTGIMKVRSYLNYDTGKPVTSINRPRLFINPACLNTIKSFQHWSRNPNNGKVEENYKDFMDVVRYLAMSEPRIEEPMPAQEFKKKWG